MTEETKSKGCGKEFDCIELKTFLHCGKPPHYKLCKECQSQETPKIKCKYSSDCNGETKYCEQEETLADKIVIKRYNTEDSFCLIKDIKEFIAKIDGYLENVGLDLTDIQKKMFKIEIDKLAGKGLI